MTYLKGLSDAEDDRNTTLDSGLGLAGNELFSSSQSLLRWGAVFANG